MTTKTKKISKMQIAINLINQNPNKPEPVIGQMIADALGIKLGNAIHNYYKAPIRKGLCDIKSRLLPEGKKQRTRKVRAKTKEVPVADLLPSPVVIEKTAALPGFKKVTTAQVDDFKAGLARAKARAEAKKTEGEMEMPSFLRRA